MRIPLSSAFVMSCARNRGCRSFDCHAALHHPGLHIDKAQRERVTHRNQIRSLFRRLNSGETRNLERISFRVPRERRQHHLGEFDECCGSRLAPRRNLRAHIDHARLARLIVVRQRRSRRIRETVCDIVDDQFSRIDRIFLFHN